MPHKLYERSEWYTVPCRKLGYNVTCVRDCIATLLAMNGNRVTLLL